MHDVEAVGLVKMDFLGLRTLTVIHDTLAALQQRGILIDWHQVGLADAETFALLQSGETTGVFQFESSAGQRLLRDMRPTTFADIAAATALNRPGPLDATDADGVTMAEHYIRRKNGLEPVHYAHPSLESVLAETYGVMVYQEQYMRVAQVLAGYSMADADQLRKIIGKKLRDQMQAEREKFVTGCQRQGVETALAEAIFDQIEAAGNYSFNKSHAVEYALLTYRTAYLKAHYPAEYFAAVLSSVTDSADKMAEYLAEVRRLQIPLRPPSINASGKYFLAHDGVIHYPLSAVKGVGKTAVDTIVALREQIGGTFPTLIDWAWLTRANKTVAINLAKVGAFDEYGYGRQALVDALPSILQHLQHFRTKIERPRKRPLPLAEIIAGFDIKLALNSGNDPWTVVRWEQDLLGIPLTYDPLSLIETQWRQRIRTRAVDLPDLPPKSAVVMGGVLEQARTITGTLTELTFRDPTGRWLAVSYHNTHQPVWQLQWPYMIRGVVRDYRGTRQVTIREVTSWPNGNA